MLNDNQALEIVSNFSKAKDLPMLETLMFLEDNLLEQSNELQQAYIITKSGFQKMFAPVDDNDDNDDNDEDDFDEDQWEIDIENENNEIESR